MTSKPICIWFQCLLLTLGVGVFSHGSLAHAGHVESDIVSHSLGLSAGEKTELGLKLEVEKGWHVYWKNPGDTGLAPKLKLIENPRVQMQEFRFPIPERFDTGNLTSFGYEKSVFIPFDVVADPQLTPGVSETLKFEAKWLVCKDVCVPEKKEISISLPVLKNSENKAGPSAEDFTQMEMAIPKPGAGWKIEASRSDQSLQLKVMPPSSEPAWALNGARVLFETSGVIQYSASGSMSLSGPKEDSFYVADFKLKESAHLDADLPIVLDLGKGQPPVRLLLEKKDIKEKGAFASAGSGAASLFDIIQMSIFALFGGLILNLMPCVFPVLSIKILGIVQEAGSSKKKIRLSGLLYTAGVLCTFWLLAGTLIFLQRAGSQIGWGFQLQSPGFVAFLAILFFLMGLNLLGVFEVGTSIMGVGGSLTQSEGKFGSFMTGVLSVVVASPCTAPFMGVALGFALSQSAFTAFFVFTSLALGLSSPFLVISFFPALAAKLPRPGVWMSTLKSCLAFPLFGTVAWMLWILSIQAGTSSLLQVLLALVALGMASWVYGQFAQLGKTTKSKNRGKGFSFALLALGLFLVYAGVKRENSKLKWEAFSEARLAELRMKSTPVLIDYTAAWCLTCQVNEKLAFTSDEVIARLKEKSVATLRADWTNEDPVITESLKSFGRSGVPLYVLYPANSKDAPKVLPQVLTAGLLLEELNAL
jgi:thiol:disulfide interchange protein DsbD